MVTAVNITRPHKKTNILFGACFAVCIIYSIWILTKGVMSDYSMEIGILPIAYFLVLGIVLIYSPDIINNVAFIMLIGAFFTRLVLYPIMVVVGGLALRANTNTHILYNINGAVALQIYEYIVCMIAAVMWIKKRPAIEQAEIKVVNIQKCYMYPMIVAAVIGCIMYPTILESFTFLFQSDPLSDAMFQERMIELKESLPGWVFYIFFWFISVLRFVALYFVLIVLKKKSLGKNPLFYVVVSFLILPVIIIYTTSDRAACIYALFAYIILLSKLYPEYEKNIIKIAVVGIIIIASVVLLILPIIGENNFTQSLIFNNLSIGINAYFGGTVNVAAAMDMEPLTYNTVMGDIVTNVPLLPYFFKNLTSSRIIFNRTIGVNAVNNTQIIPNIGLGYSYFGAVLSPIFSLILLKMGINAYKEYKNSFQLFIGSFMMLYCILGIVTYNFFLVIYLLLQYTVPLSLVEYISRRIKLVLK